MVECVELRVSLDLFEERNVFCPHRKSKYVSSAAQPGYPISCGVKTWSLITHRGHELPTFQMHRLQLSKTRGKNKKIIEGKQLLSTLTPTMAFITKWANKTIAHYSNTNIPWGETLEK
jgi:hypothetical protein